MIVIMSILRSLIERGKAGERTLAVGHELFRLGDPVERMYVVSRGEIALERHSTSGVRLVLQRARVGDIVAEPSVFADRYHCGAVATEAATVAYAPVSLLRSELTKDGAALEQVARRFARDVQTARLRAEILTLRRIAERVDAWLDLNGGKLPDKGNWLTLAAELAVTPEALYRELARRRRALQPLRKKKALRA